MKNSILPTVVIVSVLALGGVAVSVVPSLQGVQATSRREASPRLEEARRALGQYRSNVEMLGAILDDLSATDLDTVSLDDETIDRLLETRRHDLAQADDRIEEHFGQGNATRRNQLDERFLKAAHGSDWQSHRERPAGKIGANLAQLREAIQGGREARDRFIAHNSVFLAEAEQAIEAAIGAMEEAKGPTFMHAQRLRGMVAYHRGEAAHRTAIRLRRDADRHRSALTSLVAHIDASVIEHDLLERSGLDQRIAEATAETDALAMQIRQLESRLAELGTTADDLGERANEQRKVALAARAEMDRLSDQGVDLTLADGADRFAAAYHEQAKVYRTALAAAQALEQGTLTNAKIDDSRDLLRGDYVAADGSHAVGKQRGLRAVQAEIMGLEQRLDSHRSQAANHQTDIARMTEMRDTLAQAGRDARARTAALGATAEQVWNELTVASDQVTAAEDLAISKLTRAGTDFSNSRLTAESWLRDARTAAQGITNPETRGRSSVEFLQQSGEIPGYARAQTGDCSYRLGLVYFDRHRDAERTLELLDAAREVAGLARLGTDQLTGLEETAANSFEKGRKALEAAAEAWEQSGGPLKDHWTIAAELAVAMESLARFGDSGLRDLAIANYEAAIAGSPDPSYVQAYVARIRQLERQ